MKALVVELNVPRILVSKICGVLTPRAYLWRHAALQYKDVPDVELPAEDWVIIKVRYCGICGSDYKQVFAVGNWDNPMTSLISFPQILGHEVVGTIERVGSLVRDRRVGERVVLNPWLSCQPRGFSEVCPSCRNGNVSRCYNFHRGIIPVSAARVFRGLSFVPKRQCIPLLQFSPRHHSSRDSYG